jgi:hypothetical protein
MPPKRDGEDLSDHETGDGGVGGGGEIPVVWATACPIKKKLGRPRKKAVPSDGPPVPKNPVGRPKKNVEEADIPRAREEEPKKVDDQRPEHDIKGAEGEYALFPEGHQPIYQEPGEAPALANFGGRRWTRSSEAWQRLKIDKQELYMKASKEKYFRVAPPETQNTTRHFHHAGPHLCMVFDITEQGSLDSGDSTMKILLFLTHMVNQSTDLRGCIATTHYTDLDISPGKSQAVCGLFYHGGHRKGSGGVSAKKPLRSASISNPIPTCPLQPVPFQPVPLQPVPFQPVPLHLHL